jgi:hypothetical protein
LVEELDDAQQHDEHEGDTEDGSAGWPVEEDDHERGEHNDRDAQDTAVLVHPRSHRTLLQAPPDSSVAQPLDRSGEGRAHADCGLRRAGQEGSECEAATASRV